MFICTSVNLQDDAMTATFRTIGPCEKNTHIAGCKAMPNFRRRNATREASAVSDNFYGTIFVKKPSGIKTQVPQCVCFSAGAHRSECSWKSTRAYLQPFEIFILNLVKTK